MEYDKVVTPQESLDLAFLVGYIGTELKELLADTVTPELSQRAVDTLLRLAGTTRERFLLTEGLADALGL